MQLNARLAGNTIALGFSRRAAAGMRFCRFYLKEFIVNAPVEARIGLRIDVVDERNGNLPFGSSPGETLFESLVPAEPVSEWLGDRPDILGDFPIGENTVCARCLNGLLLFDPGSSAGQLMLLDTREGCFRPLHRLMWMYFAQVLGERQAAFVHCSAISRKGKGYLFWGDSGAGKSTLAQKNGGGGIVLSDDSPIFFRKDGGFGVCASPFHQLDPGEGLQIDAIGQEAAVEAFYFLLKDNRLFRREVTRQRALPLIVQKYIHFFPYLSTGARAGLFDMFFESTGSVPSYDLHFAPAHNIWEVIDAV